MYTVIVRMYSLLCVRVDAASRAPGKRVNVERHNVANVNKEKTTCNSYHRSRRGNYLKMIKMFEWCV